MFGIYIVPRHNPLSGYMVIGYYRTLSPNYAPTPGIARILHRIPRREP